MAWIAPIAGAVIGAVASKQGADAANKPKNSSTNQTTTQNPWLSGVITPDIGQVLDYQRGMIQRGAPQVDAHGNITYARLPTGDEPVPQSTQNFGNPNYRPPIVGSGGQGGGGGSAGGGNNGGGLPTKAGTGGGGGTWTNAKGQVVTLGAGRKVVPASGGGGTSGGPAPGPGTPAYNDPNSILSEVARRGFAAGGTGTITGARNAMANIWGDAGQIGGSAAGGEQTGFGRYNPVLDRLTGTLEQDVADRNGRDLLLGFLGEDGRGGGGAGGAGGGSGNGGYDPYAGGGYSGGGGGGTWTGAGWTQQQPQSPASYGGVPDTMAPESYFGTQTRRMFDDPTNDADLQTVIDSMNADAQRGMYADMAQLDAASQGSGRLGGDTWKAMAGDTRRTAQESMLANSANVRLTDRQQRTQAKLAALGLIDQRDLGLLGANVQRDGYASNERISAGNNAASAAGSADQLALARRGQDLSAIGSLMDNERYSLGQLGQVGGQLSQDRLSSLGMVPGLEGVGLSGLNAALGAGGQYVDMRGQDTALKQTQIGAGTQRAAMAQQLGLWNAGSQQNAVNSYLQTLMGIGGMGGTSHTEGTNVVPGMGVSSTGAALQGALGGAAAGYGIYQQYR